MQTQQVVFFKGDEGTNIKTPDAGKNERGCATLKAMGIANITRWGPIQLGWSGSFF
jgi:hypothetical protein